MEFRIADTFTDSLARLTGEEQKSVKTTAFDLQLNPANPGMSFHKLDRAKDKNFWSIRVSSDIRLIVHKTAGSLLLCYVSHHDKAYEWAERRKLEMHPKTGAAQFVEIRETVREIVTPYYVREERPALQKPKLFDSFSNDELLQLGVPQDWINDVKGATEDTLLIIADHLPAEAGEALLEIATGGKRKSAEIPSPAEIDMVAEPRMIDPFAHPDAKRRFRTIRNVEELERAFEYPWDKWAIFLHPAQLDVVRHRFSGPARVTGSAGTGKTIVAIHRAVFLARNNPDSRVLLTTYSKMLANALKVKIRRLISSEPQLAERLDVYSINEVGLRLYKSTIGKPDIIDDSDLKLIINEASGKVVDHKFSQAFLFSEFEQVIDAWQIKTWEEYRDVKRLGRKTRLPEKQRELLWNIFSTVIDAIKAKNRITIATLFTDLATRLRTIGKHPYDFAIIDEAQDMGIYHMRFLSALCGHTRDGLFFAGDQGQRIFQQPFSWKALGVDIRGRSKTLNVNYRTSHQIRRKADMLLSPEVTDADGNVEDRDRTISVFNGLEPNIQTFEKVIDESGFVGEWIRELVKEGYALHEIGLFVRSAKEIGRAKEAADIANVPYMIIDETMESISGKLVIGTMHLAKGLEFKAVVVMACDDEIIPSQERIESITDNADLEDVYNTERHLLYVACTRARDQLLITSVQPASEFLADINS
jgi:mRNA-degrading endonuclease RelE of RelBE toxin-antitoxin system